MKKVLSIVLCTVMLLSLFVVSTSAAAWDGTTVSTSLKGEGTQASPYLVETAADLAFLSKSVSDGTTYEGKYITQTADIDLGGKAWTSIGSNAAPFSGIYDGKGNDVTGYSGSVTSAFIGFFGCLKSTDTNQAAILNLNLQGKIDSWTFNAASDALVAGLAGKLEGKAEKPIVIANCVVDVDIDVTVPTATDGKIMYIGGIGGWNSNVTVVNTVNKGDVTVKSDGRHLLIGGILGNAYNNITLENVTNYGNVNIEVKSGHLAVASGMIGRANGAQTAACKINNSVNYGNVNSVGGSNAFAAGVIAQGFNANTRNTTLENCANAGKIDAKTTKDSANAYAGGIYGYENVGYTTIKNCANKGEVTASGVNKEMLPGGIIGVSNFSGKNSKVENCNSTIKAVGWTNDTATIAVNCVSDAQASVIDAAIKAIEDAQKATTSVTVNGTKLNFAVETVTPTPTPTPTPNPGTGDVATLLVVMAIISLAGVVVTKKVSAR